MAIFTQAQWRAFKNCSISVASDEYAGIKRNFLAGNVGKYVRPWFVLDFSMLLPANSTMMGWELEGGFRSADARTEFMNWLWDNTDYVTADHEGCNEAPVEITFPPLTVEELLSDSNQILEMFTHNQSLAAARRFQSVGVSSSNPRGSNVGSHINISTAAYRNADNSARSSTIRRLQAFFGGLSPEHRYALQGRQPYIEDVARGRGGRNGSTTDGCLRIEFKMFHTTTHLQQFRNYCLVSKRLAEVIDDLISGATFTDEDMFLRLTQDLPDRTVIAPDNEQYTGTIYQQSRVHLGYVPPVQVAEAA